MVALIYGTSAYMRQRGDLPELPVINMFAEIAASETETTLQSRPGLEYASLTMGSGPVRGLFQIDGVLDNILFGVSGDEFYADDTYVGDVSGSGPVSFAGYESNIFVNSGQHIHGYDGTTYTTVAFPDSADVCKIVVGSSRLLAVRKDTGRFYWSDPLTSTIDDLSFATAENSPDKSKDILFVGDTAVIFGSETVEFWPSVPDDVDLPFQPTPGRVYQTGIKDTGCATIFKDTWAWITNNNEVCVTDPETVISDPAIEVRISNASTVTLWNYVLDGVDFLVVSMTGDDINETWAYHSRNNTWAQLESYGYDNWVCQCFTGNYFGLRNTGQLATWSDGYSDFSGVLERRFRAGMEITGGTEPLNNVIIRTNPGQTTFLTGGYSNPIIELRTSRDGGFTWGPWKQRRLGTQGSYQTKSIWTSLGAFAYPGVMIEFRVTDPVPFRVSGVSANELYGGL